MNEPLISFDDAQRKVLDLCNPLGSTLVPTLDSVGYVLAEPLVARIASPRFDNSAVDGYAVRFTQVGESREFQIVGEQMAGGLAFGRELNPGEALRIMTGAPTPVGTEAIAMVEDCRVLGNVVRIEGEIGLGTHIRRAGEDYSEGDELVAAGAPVTPPIAAVAASNGLADLNVFRRPSISVVTTGDELAVIGEPLQLGQIYDSNSVGIQLALRAAGFRDMAFGPVADQPEALLETFATALEQSNVLITCGAVSVGDRDHVRPVLERLGVKVHIHRIALRPGKPFLFGTLGEKRVFGLPGNPVSALATFSVLALPALRKMSGEGFGLTGHSARLTSGLPVVGVRTDLLRGVVRLRDTGWEVEPLSRAGSHQLLGIAQANCLIVRPAFAPAADPGDVVQVMELPWRGFS